ncbi:MAG: glycoside hydrolase family 2 TIM barrel-domain containing protein [Prolixibacteraceae bacterium]
MKQISLNIYLVLTACFILVRISGIGNNYKSEREAIRDASSLDWRLWGYRPNVWRMNFDFNKLSGNWAEITGIPATVPGSVQNALKEAALIPDWNIGLNYRSIEWIENRHWIFAAKIPDEWVIPGKQIILNCSGLDHKGILFINGKEAGNFSNAFIPYSFTIDSLLKENNNTMAFVFECPPENLAQIGWTSKITDWKPRFYYGWDWVPRLVQIGIWDKISFVAADEDSPLIGEVHISADVVEKTGDKGILGIKLALNNAALKGKVKVLLFRNDKKIINEEIIKAESFTSGKTWDNLKVDLWWPNGVGEQPLYRLQLTLLDEDGHPAQQVNRRIGFRQIHWLPCEGSRPEAEPWLCHVNNRPVFLQGINWTPIRPNFADLKEEDYQVRLQQYKNLGINTIRVWGGGFPEKDWLYDLCDELGILVWQDFPLSSSGLDNYPPDGPAEIYTMTRIVSHYVTRLQHHACLLLWCAGNELYDKGDVAPITDKHPLIYEMKKRVQLLDPARKFVDGTPSGPTIYASLDNFGSGNNWDVHGPWQLPFADNKQDMNDVRNFWEKGDALIHSEVGAPAAMSAEMIKKYCANYNPLPASSENPIWRTVNWWVEWDQYLSAHEGKAPATLENYVDWSQKRQLEGLCIALKSSKDRFPRCGGFIIWMGHDCFPCMINTSIIDFEGNPKPSASELSKIWKSSHQ